MQTPSKPVYADPYCILSICRPLQSQYMQTPTASLVYANPFKACICRPLLHPF